MFPLCAGPQRETYTWDPIYLQFYGSYLLNWGGGGVLPIKLQVNRVPGIEVCI